MFPKVRKPLSLLLVFMMCFTLFSGCNNSEEQQITPSNSPPAETKNVPETDSTQSADGKLNIYLNGLELGPGATLQRVLVLGPQKKNVKLPDILNVKLFATSSEMENEMLPELLAGKGPDIFIFDSTILPNYKQYIKQGLFCDLNKLIEQDQSSNPLDLSLYNQDVLDEGVWDQKRCFIPLGYLPIYFITTQEMCDKYDVQIPEDGVTYEEFPDVFHNFIKQETGNIPLLYPTSFFFRETSYSFLDMNTQTCSFDSEEYKKSIRILEDITTYTTASLTDFVNNYRSDERTNAVTDGNLFCNYLYNKIGAEINREYNIISEANQNMVLFGLKDPESGGYYGHTTYCFAINANSKKKDLALDYLKALLSEEFQGEPQSPVFQSVFGLPVLNSVRDEAISTGMWDQDSMGEPAWLPETPEAEAYVQKFAEISGNVTSCYMADGRWEQEIFDPLYDDYDKGKITADQFAQALQQKTNLFLKE